MQSTEKRKVGIMGAMLQEVNDILGILANKEEHHFGNRVFYTGTINNIDVVVVFSRWGKVAAATTVSTLILQFNITELLFTGVAGAISQDLKIGDIVIGKRFYQHDMDARPLMQEFEIPLLGVQYFTTKDNMLLRAEQSIVQLFQNNHHHKYFSADDLEMFGIQQPTIYIGDIASGDQFFSDADSKTNLSQKLPSVLCVEMEGAAVAQVCYEYNIPYCIIRTISDTADEQSTIDFLAFTEKIASKYSLLLVKQLI